MYAFISGIIDEKSDNAVIIDCNGVGYEIFVSTSTLSNLPSVGEMVKIYTYLQVREDAMLLYGFSSIEEKNMFLELITVSGVGPKMALVILSSLNLNSLISCIATGDVTTLSKAKGVGKKTAERIVVELKSKLGDLNMPLINNYNDANINSTSCDEATELLVSMGLSKFDALNLVKKVSCPDDTTEVIVQKALRNMN